MYHTKPSFRGGYAEVTWSSNPRKRKIGYANICSCKFNFEKSPLTHQIVTEMAISRQRGMPKCKIFPFGPHHGRASGRCNTHVYYKNNKNFTLPPQQKQSGYVVVEQWRSCAIIIGVTELPYFSKITGKQLQNNNKYWKFWLIRPPCPICNNARHCWVHYLGMLLILL